MKLQRNSFYYLLFAGLAFFLIQSCEKEGKGKNETNISAHGLNKSHNMGQNCMNCHKSGGEGEGWFNVAGTVYDSLKSQTYANATIHLYTGPNGSGTLKYTILGDAKGNFYTTESIDFGSGLYPVVAGAQGTQYMSTSITAGQCNSCHGVSTSRLWTK